VTRFSYFDLLLAAAPEAILVIAALVVLALDHAVLRHDSRGNRFLICAGFACFGCALAGIWLAAGSGQTNLLGGMLVSDPIVRWVKIGLVTLTAVTILSATGSKFTEHVGEYLALILLATVGMMFLASSEEILTLFVALELTSLALYVLAAFDKHNPKSAEAALKYFLFGGMSAAFLLFGLSLVYGLTGETSLVEIARQLRLVGLDPLLGLALVMIVIGFGFKIAAVPFHLWAPDAYEGAPPPSAALIASGSKLASFFALAKVLSVGFAAAAGSGAWRQFTPG
jgi:NADH-quinone oxidoreductase subunit N